MVTELEAPAFADFSVIIQNLGPKQIRIILWAGLLHMCPDLTPQGTYAIINEYLEKHSLKQLTDVVIGGLQQASILANAEGGNDKGEAKR
jgi:hypothetical protein